MEENSDTASAAGHDSPQLSSANERESSPVSAVPQPDGQGTASRNARAINWNQTRRPRPALRTSLGGQKSTNDAPAQRTTESPAEKADHDELASHSQTSPEANQEKKGFYESKILEITKGESLSQPQFNGIRTLERVSASNTAVDPRFLEERKKEYGERQEEHDDKLRKLGRGDIVGQRARRSAAWKEASLDAISSDQTSDYEDDHGVMLNVETEHSGSESGEISEGDEAVQEHIVIIDDGYERKDEDGEISEDADDESIEESDEEPDEEDFDEGSSDSDEFHDASEGEVQEDEDGDAMMHYSDSTAKGKHTSASPTPAPQNTSLPSTIQSPLPPQDPSLDLSPGEHPTILAHLGYDDLKLQLRYFYITRDPRTVPRTDPVRCLCCAKPGHMASLPCPALTCSTCGLSNVHPSILCPQATYCSRCRKKGHSRHSCPSPLKMTPAEHMAIACQLCNRRGHIETRCELLWRTSGYPWTTDVPVGVPLSCYECGKAGHLGNDCPTRRPGKSMGSSSWSAKAWAEPHPTAGIVLSDDEESWGESQRGGIGSGRGSQIGDGKSVGESRGGKAVGVPGRGNRGGRGKTSHTAPIQISSDSDSDQGLAVKGARGRGSARGRGRPRGSGGMGISIKGLGRGSAPTGPARGAPASGDGGGRGGGGGNGGGGRGGSNDGARGGQGDGPSGTGRGAANARGRPPTRAGKRSVRDNSGPQPVAPPGKPIYDYFDGGYKYHPRGSQGSTERRRSRSPPRRGKRGRGGGGGGGGGGGDSYVPMPSSAKNAYRKSRT